ncbi:MAG: hypothetical protein KAR33_12290, partial [Candidatus Thorarchaeota archaeon]|nr:hypothetical protein [Candidatus Thorarchaeota archaeon]
MKPYQIILAALFVCVVFGLQGSVADPSAESQNLNLQTGPMSLADIAPFETALVWENNTGSQIVDIAVGNYDLDAKQEVAVITANGTLFFFDDNGHKISQLNLSTTPYVLAEVSTDAIADSEVLIGTSDGILVVKVDTSVIANIALPSEVRTVIGADVDNDGFDELIAGTENNIVYAFELGGTQNWNFTSNSAIRFLDAADTDVDANEEVLAGSLLNNVTYLDHDGSISYNTRATASLNVIRLAYIKGTGNANIIFGDAGGALMVIDINGTTIHSLTLDDAVTAIDVDDLMAAAGNELVVGTAGAEVRIYNTTAHLQWNKTLAASITSVLTANVAGAATPQLLVAENGGPVKLYNSTGYLVS